MARVRVPVIDMQKVEGSSEEIVKAFEEWGCFRMVNHGVPSQLMADMKALTASLFDLPEEIQDEMANTKHGMGYIKRGVINPFYESLSISNILSIDNLCDNLVVSTHQREIIYKYTQAIHDLARLLGHKLMKGHGLVGDLFDDGWCCELRMIKYHFCQESVGLSGTDLHSDHTFLTILLDDENLNGLQVVDKYSGEFVTIDHVPDTLVVNVGDIGKIWSNGRYCNVLHKVRCLEPKVCYSIAFFMFGPTDTKVEAPSKLVDTDHPRLYVPFDYKEYKQVRTTKRAITGGAVDLFSINSTP
ncbi:putative gibberellin 3-beta-dioxygenase [Helianthus annuus]|uniref:Gibberellin 3-beta-dioxygenase n=1 Tax=Helianthus annuus TaxID=4232 RepID=A0A251VQN7_HELAN|nr:2-oxoglutarate-dependent dioxygenase DAO [Helianthus annuus]KAF5814697.1 putative gibberellin 3-beta-dioxygenase [Helianthus annuus]KAJ0593272.1 putative gibberellin 3-beta-dioxygenase [Helianthus annuus]KAJ0601109.1 putative gibberellin 3-beta-dioxygenase [Helianthus annuus]KAJ0608281.1 putative gibberellin 3-beta-dioxygenase [Helianthus annuus]KAJ0768347.1 putative gibberellin 3-beta-dioxygenase [Helianthus annuus]